MLPGLINKRSRDQLNWIEVADCEPVEPRFTVAREAAKPRLSSVPLGHIDAIGPALAEQQSRHEDRV
jgi:hypothetical protein